MSSAFLKQYAHKDSLKPEEDSLKRKRGGEEKEASSLKVTKALLQLSSKEDVRPAALKSDTHIALLVGDGHGGDATAKCLSKNATKILNETLKSGVEAGMLMSQRKCKDFTDGAMLVIALYEFATRKIQIISVGDASCSVYQNETLLHSQPHQDAESFMNVHEDGVCEGKTFDGKPFRRGTVEVKRNNGLVNMGNKLTPDKNGKTMHFPEKPSYMCFRVGRSLLYNEILASGGFVGHKNVPRLAPVMTEFKIPKGTFHVVMSSDGVSDVMHPEDALACRDDVTAVEILEECKKRWTTPYWTFNGKKNVPISRMPTVITANGRRVSTYEKTLTGYSVTYVGEEDAVNVETIEETNRGADDISVLVFSDG